MCFSPQADGGGLLICAIGGDAVRHIGRRREFIALAWIPALLVPTSSSRRLYDCGFRAMCRVGSAMLAMSRCGAYLLIAFVVLPVFVPLAVIADSSPPAGRHRDEAGDRADGD